MANITRFWVKFQIPSLPDPSSPALPLLLLLPHLFPKCALYPTPDLLMSGHAFPGLLQPAILYTGTALPTGTHFLLRSLLNATLSEHHVEILGSRLCTGCPWHEAANRKEVNLSSSGDQGTRGLGRKLARGLGSSPKVQELRLPFFILPSTCAHCRVSCTEQHTLCVQLLSWVPAQRSTVVASVPP